VRYESESEGFDLQNLKENFIRLKEKSIRVYVSTTVSRRCENRFVALQIKVLILQVEFKIEMESVKTFI